jgi:integrase
MPARHKPLGCDGCNCTDYARKHSRYGHRDSTMILVTYRHGLRASEVCDLQWHQVELDQGRMHVRRAKNGHAIRPSYPGR